MCVKEEYTFGIGGCEEVTSSIFLVQRRKARAQ